jgi:hypothetical protein
MKCKEFHHWLRTRVRNTPDSPEAREHRLGCPDCRRLYDLDTQAEQGIALAFATRELPRDLADQIDQRLDLEMNLETTPSKYRPKPFAALKYTGWIAGFMGVVIILAGIFTLQPPSFKSLEQISNQAVMDHLKGNRKISFDADALFQALEMFKRELGFNILLPDLAAQGCFLVGGRLCALGNCKAAYFVIEKQGKNGSLFIMDVDHLEFEVADGTRFSTTIKGCDTQVWKNNDQIYATVF